MSNIKHGGPAMSNHIQRDEIIAMATEAGIPALISIQMKPALERFAELVAEKEREACAKVCEALRFAIPTLEAFRKQNLRCEHDDSIDVLELAKAALAAARGEKHE